MDDQRKEELMGMLIDKYGVAFSQAKDILENKDAELICSLMAKAYKKGLAYSNSMETWGSYQ